MAAVVRIVENSADLGLVPPTARITWQLVDGFGRTVENMVDAVNRETIPARVQTVYADNSGLFSVALWPTSRGGAECNYRVRVFDTRGRQIFSVIAPLPDGATVYRFGEFVSYAGVVQGGQSMPGGGGGFPDAPNDGKYYIRRNEQWEELSISL